jgi:hypothetical protein
MGVSRVFPRDNQKAGELRIIIMTSQAVSIIVPEVEVQAIKTAVATIKAKLPILTRLTTDPYRTILKNGMTVPTGLPVACPAATEAGRSPENSTMVKDALNDELVTVLADLVAAVEQLVAEMDGLRPADEPATKPTHPACALTLKSVTRQFSTPDTLRIDWDTGAE